MFIPAQGAANGSSVPPQPGGLFHGTRVSFVPMALNKKERDGAIGLSGKDVTRRDSANDVVCMDVRPMPGQTTAGLGLSCGVESAAGAKEQNDDRIAATDLKELGFLCGVFDGHRGHACSEYVAKSLPGVLHAAYQTRAKRQGSLIKLSHEEEAALISGAFKDAFDEVDRAYLVSARKKEQIGGSTAIVALVSHGFEVALALPDASTLGAAALWPKVAKEPVAQERPQPCTVPSAKGGVAKLFLGWAGDCRAVLCRGRTGLRVSEDHRPQRADERKRIERAGGTIVQDRRGVWRVGPRPENRLVRDLQKRKATSEEQMKWYLSTTRSFGDPDLKAPDPVVIASPEIKVVDLTPDDWALVLASDGVFDKLSDQDVANCVWKAAAEEGKDAVKAAREVVRAALARGSRDNCTAVVLRLGWAPAPSSAVTAASAASASAAAAGTGSDSPDVVVVSAEDNMFG